MEITIGNALQGGFFVLWLLTLSELKGIRKDLKMAIQAHCLDCDNYKKKGI